MLATILLLGLVAVATTTDMLRRRICNWCLVGIRTGFGDISGQIRQIPPHGGSRWQKNTAVRLGLECTLHPRGRRRGREKSCVPLFVPWRRGYHALERILSVSRHMLVVGFRPSSLSASASASRRDARFTAQS